MKNKKIIKSIIIAIFLISLGVLVTVIFNSEYIHAKIHNDGSVNVDIKENILADEESKTISPLTDDDFVIKDDNNYIELGGEYDDLKTDQKIIEITYPDERHAYSIYEYEDFKICTGGIIWQIDLTTSTLQTSRGIKIGDPITQVLDNYGDEYKLDGYYEYNYKDSYIKFYFDESGKVSKIRLGLL